MGIIGDFFVGAGQTGERIGLAQIQSDIEEKKTARLAELAEQSQIRTEGRREDSQIRQEDRSKIAATVLRADEEKERIAKNETDFTTRNDPTRTQIENDTAALKAKGAGIIGREQTDLNNANNASPENLDATRKIAQAGHIAAPGAYTQAASLDLAYEDAKFRSDTIGKIRIAVSNNQPELVASLTAQLNAGQPKDLTKSQEAQLKIYHDGAKLAGDTGDTVTQKAFLQKAQDLVTNIQSGGNQNGAPLNLDKFNLTIKPGGKPTPSNPAPITSDAGTTTIDAGPKEGDVRSIVAGRGRGNKEQEYRRIGRSSTFQWVDK